MAREYGLVDTLLNLPGKPGHPAVDDPNIARWFHHSKVLMEGASNEETLSDLDTSGIEKGLITKLATPRTDEEFEKIAGELAEAAEASNGRLWPFLLFDPRDGMAAVRRLETSVKEYGMVTAHIVPSGVGLPPSDALYYPLYAKCVELGVPIRINVGFPGFMAPAKHQRPTWTRSA